MSIKDRLLQAMADGPMSAPEIERATGLTSDQVRPALTYLRKGGSIVRARVGRTRSRAVRWRLAVDA